MFWLLHFWELPISPVLFFVIVPITTLVLSLLVVYSKRIFPAIIFHTATNALVILIAQFYMK